MRDMNRIGSLCRRLVLLSILINVIYCEEDSLQSALKAIDRRQRDLSDYYRYDDVEYGYPLERSEELAFLKGNPYENDREYENNSPSDLVEYLDEESDRYEPELNKKISSSFRERLEEANKKKQYEDIASNLLGNDVTDGDASAKDNNDDYDELIKEIWERYQQQRQYDAPKSYDIDKRLYYPNFGLDSIGLRKRSRYFNPDGPNESSMYLLNYVPRDEIFNNLEENNFDDEPKYFQRDRKFYRHRRTYPYSQVNKRFPVAKRSSDLKEIHEKKRSANRKQTDPKVEKELINIFGANQQTTQSTTDSSVKKVKKTNEEKKQVVLKKERKSGNKANTKEETPQVSLNEKPLQIKKKSIDWSDYFGLDRRKKSNQLDNEWLLNRYHKAIELANKRREYALHNRQQSAKKPSGNPTSPPATTVKDNLIPDEKKIAEMDMKLKTMEDTIVDDALKYTGAHQGATNTNEIQQVKDKVISRLAAAYSLEKMRNALNEYKLSVSKEQEHVNKPGEDKRTVGRKQAVDESRENIPEGDNNIKCAHGSEDCQEQNYPTPNEILESHFGTGVCPTIQRTCNEVGLMIGSYGQLFEKACNFHQMCLLCSSNSWFTPARKCNALFLEKSYELCKGKPDCREQAERTIHYLLNIYFSLQSHAQLADECELACPENNPENVFKDAEAR